MEEQSSRDVKKAVRLEMGRDTARRGWGLDGAAELVLALLLGARAGAVSGRRTGWP
jgi:hypothetical protein